MIITRQSCIAALFVDNFPNGEDIAFFNIELRAKNRVFILFIQEVEG